MLGHFPGGSLNAHVYHVLLKNLIAKNCIYRFEMVYLVFMMIYDISCIWDGRASRLSTNTETAMPSTQDG